MDGVTGFVTKLVTLGPLDMTKKFTLGDDTYLANQVVAKLQEIHAETGQSVAAAILLYSLRAGGTPLAPK